MLTIIVKGTNGCNLACSYCSLGKKKNFQYVGKQKLKEIFLYSCEYAKNKGKTKVSFILHGGEPTLVQIDVYREAIEMIKRKYTELDLSFSMQSNGLMITDDFIKFAYEYDIHMGISVDGSEEIHNSERRTPGGGPSFKQIANNIDKLLAAGVNVSCLMVLTKHAINKGYKYLRYFEERHLHLKINPLLNYGEAYEHPELLLENGDYANYLIGLYEYVIKEDIAITISPSDNILKAVLYKMKIGECSFNQECSKHFICIDYKGDIYPCGKFSDMDIFKLGNIADTPIKELGGKIMENLYKRRNEQKPKKCCKCKYLNLCNGGCSAEAVIDGNFNKTPILCEDYRILFDYFSKDGLLLLKDELLRQKRVLEERHCEL